MSSVTRSTRRAKRARTALAASVATIGLAGAGLGLAPAAVADTPAVGPGSGNNAAIFGPLLQIAFFGTQKGLGIGCETAFGYISAGGADFGVTTFTAPLVNALSQACDQIDTVGAQLVNQAQQAIAPLSILDQFVNPVLAATAATIQQLGNTYATTLAPFGPTIAGLGGTLSFFEGS